MAIAHVDYARHHSRHPFQTKESRAGLRPTSAAPANSSAAPAIATREGAGKLRHISISCLWIQEKQDKRQIELRKVVGTENPAGMMIKHLARHSVDKCMMQLARLGLGT